MLFRSKEIWFVLHDTDSFPVAKVEVKGSLKHIPHATIEQIIQPDVSVGFFALPVAKLKSELQALPWVESVTLHRSWPDRLVVNIQEQQPVAVWNHLALVNAKGELFVPAKSTFPKNLLQLSGSDASFAEVFQMSQKIDSALTGNRLPPLQQLQLTAQKDWQVQLSGVDVNLGQDHVDQHLQRLVNAFPQLQKDLSSVKYVDFRYSMGFAVS